MKKFDVILYIILVLLLVYMVLAYVKWYEEKALIQDIGSKVCSDYNGWYIELDGLCYINDTGYEFFVYKGQVYVKGGGIYGDD